MQDERTCRVVNTVETSKATVVINSIELVHTQPVSNSVDPEGHVTDTENFGQADRAETAAGTALVTRASVK
jgi:hypothetical protein